MLVYLLVFLEWKYKVLSLGVARTCNVTECALRSTVFLLFLSRSADGTCVGRNLGPEIGALLGDGSGNTRALHLTSVVNNHTSVICTELKGVLLLSSTH